jgi:hypothetical protein
MPAPSAKRASIFVVDLSFFASQLALSTTLRRGATASDFFCFKRCEHEKGTLAASGEAARGEPSRERKGDAAWQTWIEPNATWCLDEKPARDARGDAAGVVQGKRRPH